MSKLYFSKQNDLWFYNPAEDITLHDIAKLLDAFERLLRNGASILIIEHNLEVIRRADWVIDLGPEGGAAGGRVVGVGTPEEIAVLKGSYTGQYLREDMDRK